jgi:hypothetical protein
MGGKAALTRLYALERTSLVIIGRLPVREDAKASFAPEEMRNLELPFGESSPFTAGRMSMESAAHFVLVDEVVQLFVQ